MNLHLTYLLINLGIIFFPFVLSFDKKVAFHKSWKPLFVSILIVGGAYTLLDMLFVKLGVWSFNNDYVTGFYIGNLPVEECLFFVTACYSSVFIFEVLRAYFSRAFSFSTSQIFSIIFLLIFAFMLVFGHNKLHTLINCIIAIMVCVFITFVKPWKNLGYFYLSFFVSMIPFFLFDGMLAGIPVVYYNDAESLGRIMSIPYEDMVFNYTLLALTFYLFDVVKGATAIPSRN